MSLSDAHTIIRVADSLDACRFSVADDVWLTMQ